MKPIRHELLNGLFVLVLASLIAGVGFVALFWWATDIASKNRFQSPLALVELTHSRTCVRLSGSQSAIFGGNRNC